MRILITFDGLNIDLLNSIVNTCMYMFCQMLNQLSERNEMYLTWMWISRNLMQGRPQGEGIFPNFREKFDKIWKMAEFRLKLSKTAGFNWLFY